MFFFSNLRLREKKCCFAKKKNAVFFKYEINICDAVLISFVRHISRITFSENPARDIYRNSGLIPQPSIIAWFRLSLKLSFRSNSESLYLLLF